MTQVATSRFGTVVNCLDGRVQEPVARWLRERYYLDYVDVITEPGADGVLAHGAVGEVERLREKVRLTLERHGSSVIAVVGHHDCLANPGNKETHLEQIRQALAAVRLWGFTATVQGLWVNERWEVEEV
jgi:hypothetical protein